LKVACHQPNYLPWVGYFCKIVHADIFVVLDSVQLPRGTSWVTRNRIKTPYGELWLTVPIHKKGLGFQKIQDVKINDTHNWRKKHFLSLVHFYKRAPYLDEYISYFEDLYKKEWRRLLDLNLKIIRKIIEWLEIDVKIICSSELEIEAMGSDLLVEICESVGADTYISGIGGKKYIEAEKFSAQKIKIKYFSFTPRPYPQLWGDFIPNLSVVDLLFNCGKKGVDLFI
jgi:hypothetical protein